MCFDFFFGNWGIQVISVYFINVLGKMFGFDRRNRIYIDDGFFLK